MKRHKSMLMLVIGLIFAATFITPARAGNPQQIAFEQPILVVNTSFLNIRTGPSVRFTVLTTVAGGTELPVLGVAGDGVWYQVAAGGQAGWVNAEFTVGRGAFQNVPLVTVDINQAAPVAQTQSITIAPVAGVAASSAPITGDFVVAVPVDGAAAAGGGSSAGSASVAPSVPVAAPQVAASTAIVNTSFLNVRSGPGAQFTRILTARGGTQYPVLGIASDGVWFLVQTPAGQGWVNNEFVIYRGVFDTVPVIDSSATGGVIETPVALVGSSVQLYAAPGTNFGLLGTVVGPVEAPIVARTSDFEWVQINTNAGFGWVLTSQVTIRGDSSLIPVVNN